MAESMKVPGVLGNAPTGQNRNGVMAQSYDGANVRNIQSAAREHAAAPGRAQKARDLKKANTNHYAQNTATSPATKTPTTYGDGAPRIPGVERPMAPSQHRAISPRQFSSAGSAVKSAMGRLRLLKRR